ncbi:MAG: hypothetical protein HRU18_01180 [Pseudoalteromonas sp.]|uniref:hypothetical protein n=1 Tax=Pseudoalteromonas sp. TaxID=53249 RepID=UPI001E164356|nr:hypothetical protein [Pseudoalteromonas sp.]NRA76792.1 hypothetical protein [Pseudoalteromonas sp.]
MTDNRQKPYSVYLPPDIIEDIKSNRLIVSEVIRSAFIIAKQSPKYLYEVIYSRENIRFYCIVDKPKESKVMREVYRDSYLAHRIKSNGVGELDIRLIGCFPKMLDAMKVYNIYCNSSLDSGYNVLNKDFTRMIHFLAEGIEKITTVLPTEADLSVLLTEVIDILNDGKKSDITAKLEVNNAKIMKQLRKRIPSMTKLRKSGN